MDVIMREKALLFGKTGSLVGIITDPPTKEKENNLPAVIILNSGIIHRVGPNRIYVNIARSLAAMGFVVLRFDHSGIGDSKARDDNLPFEKSSISETQEAMDCLSTLRGMNRFILIGICSGGRVAFRTACCDSRVVGIVPINAPLGHRDNISNELVTYLINRKASYSYWQNKLFNPHSWLKVIKGESNYLNIIKTLGFQIRSLFPRKKDPSLVFEVEKITTSLRSLIKNGVALLFIYSEGTGVYECFRYALAEEIHRLSSSGMIRLEIIRQTDHTFTLLWSQNEILELVCNWAHAMHGHNPTSIDFNVDRKEFHQQGLL